MRDSCEAYLALPSDANLYLILAFIKVHVVSAFRGPRGKARLEAYPGTPFPARNDLTVIGGKSKKVVKLVETGRLGSAARMLAGTSQVAEVAQEVLDELQRLHPLGEARPFDDIVSPPQGRARNDEEVRFGIAALKADTAPGISRWTAALLRLASRSPTFPFLPHRTHRRYFR